jgi:hypothetical protein
MDITALKKTFQNAFNLLLDHLKHGIQVLRKGDMAVVVILLRNPILEDMEILVEVLPKIAFILATMTQTQRIDFAWTLQESLLRTNAEGSAISDIFRQIVGLFNRYVTIRVLSASDEESISSNFM